MKNLLFIFLSAISLCLLAQKKKFWVKIIATDTQSFEEKIHILTEQHYQVNKKSTWLNAVSIFLNQAEKEEILANSFVKEVSPVRHYSLQGIKKSSIQDLYVALHLMNADAFFSDSLTGKGVKIGVIDAGFTNADSSAYLAHLFKNKQFKAYRDFINPDRKDLFEEVTTSDEHGTQVLKMITGYDKFSNTQYGFALKSDFYLARTENGEKEHRVEEDDWIAALEWMHSQGVRLVSTSLGYATEMDNEDENYTTEQMDGKTAMITIAAQKAVEEKNMIIVVSAGNSGEDKSWEIITAPADAEDVISVGATGVFQEKAGYSSIGPEFLPYLKPDVSTYSANGTSFSAPIVTGFIACLLEKDPTLTSSEIKEILLEASHLYPYGNNYVGFGIPQADRALALVQNQDTTLVHYHEKIQTRKKKIKISLENNHVKDVVLFYKTNEFYVQKEVVLQSGFIKRKKNRKYGVLKKNFFVFNKFIKVKHMKGIKFTTVQIGKRVIEVEWKDKK